MFSLRVLVGGQVSAGEEEDVEEDDVTVMQLDQNGAADTGDSGGGSEEDQDDDDDDEDVDPAVNKIVDQEIRSGFLERRRWKSSSTFVCPGDGYWKDDHDDHRIQELRTSTAADLKLAKPRSAPTYISRNPFCAERPKRVFDYNLELYFLCKKVIQKYTSICFGAKRNVGSLRPAYETRASRGTDCCRHTYPSLTAPGYSSGTQPNTRTVQIVLSCSPIGRFQLSRILYPTGGEDGGFLAYAYCCTFFFFFILLYI